MEFEIDAARLLSALLLGRISRIERRGKRGVFWEKPRKGDSLLFLPMPKYWQCKIFVQDAVNAFFANFLLHCGKLRSIMRSTNTQKVFFQVQHIDVGGFYERDDSAEQYDY